MSKLTTVLALIEKAAHHSTPIEEARNAALQAARIIKLEGLVIVEANNGPESEYVEVSYDPWYDVPSFTRDDFQESVTPFVLEVAKGPMTCVKCQKEIRKGMNYAKEPGAHDPHRVTHFDCRVYFVENR